MAIEEITQTPTRLTIYPDTHQAKNTAISNAGAASSKQDSTSGTESGAEYSFWDFLDLINPLQHIPVVNTIYREVTGDTIKPEMKLAGGAALGGVLGFVTSLADVIFEQETGKDIGSTMVAAVMGEDKDAPVQVAHKERIRGKGLEIREAAALQSPIPNPQSPTPTVASAMRDIDKTSAQILSLYGSSPSPMRASKAYEQADMRGYLQQASLNATF